MTTCLRCGDFPTGEKLLAEGISLCRECFELRPLDDGFFALAAPPLVRRRRARVVLTGIGAGLVLGALLGLSLQALLWTLPPAAAWNARAKAMIAGGAFGAISGEMLVLTLLLLGRVAGDDGARWKRHLMGRLGFESVDPARFTLVTLKLAGRRPERGLLLLDDGGLALIGNRGSRLVVPFREITFAKAVAPRFFPWHVYAALRPRGGGMLVLRSIEGMTMAANRAATNELALRIAAGIAPAP